MAATQKVAAAESANNGHLRGLLSAADILAAEDLESEYVEVPEWGGVVKVRCLTGSERARIGALMARDTKRSSEEDALASFTMRIVAASLVDEEGVNLFSQKDVQALGAKSAAVLARVYDVCRRLSGIGDEAAEEAEQALKATPSDDEPGD